MECACHSAKAKGVPRKNQALSKSIQQRKNRMIHKTVQERCFPEMNRRRSKRGKEFPTRNRGGDEAGELGKNCRELAKGEQQYRGGKGAKPRRSRFVPAFRPRKTHLPKKGQIRPENKKKVHPGIPGIPGKQQCLFCYSLFLLLRAKKKKQEKGTPASPGPAGFPYFSTGAGR